jgi:hypothetical protein
VRDVLGTVLQANMAVISNQQTEISMRQNETMKQLTLVATVFLPLSCNGTVAASAKCLTAMIAFADPAPEKLVIASATE